MLGGALALPNYCFWAGTEARPTGRMTFKAVKLERGQTGDWQNYGVPKLELGNEVKIAFFCFRPPAQKRF
jgi:hypothetical protein